MSGKVELGSCLIVNEVAGTMAPIAVRADRRLGIMERPYESTWFSIIDITLFAVLIIGAIALVTRHKEWHRRFVFVAALRDRRCHTMGSWMCLVAASLAESSAVVISAEMFRGVLAP